MQATVRTPDVLTFVRRAGDIAWLPALWVGALILAFLRATAEPRHGWPLPANALEILAPFAVAAGTQYLAHTVQALRERARDRDTELASALHDLRGPLLTARSYLDLLAGEALGPLPAEAHQAVERAAVAAARAQSLAGTMGNTHPRANGRVDLDLMLTEVVSALAIEIAQASATVEIGALPAVNGNYDALYRVFGNLVENAIKYGVRNGQPPCIEVSSRSTGGRVIVSVRDRGAGIPEDEHEQVFHMHRRGRHAGQQSGQGLGLATVRRLVREQGGDVAVDSATRDGTRMLVTLRPA